MKTTTTAARPVLAGGPAAPHSDAAPSDRWRAWSEDDVLFERLRQLVRQCLAGSQPAEAWAALTDLGVAQLAAPIEAGGLGLGQGVTAMVAEEVGASMLALPVVDTAVALLLAPDGMPESHRPGSGAVVMLGRLPTPLAQPELFLTARPATDATVVSGVLGPVAAGVSPEVLLLAADVGAGWQLWAIPAEAPGVALQALDERDGDGVAKVVIDGLRIAGPPLVGADSSPARLEEAALAAAVYQAALLCGLAAAALTALTERLLQRRQFDRTLSQHQSPRFRTAALLANLDVARLAVADAAVALDRHELTFPRACGLVALAAETALEATREALHLHGAAGLAVGSTVARCYRRVAWEALRCGPLPALWRGAGS